MGQRLTSSEGLLNCGPKLGLLLGMLHPEDEIWSFTQKTAGPSESLVRRYIAGPGRLLAASAARKSLAPTGAMLEPSPVTGLSIVRPKVLKEARPSLPEILPDRRKAAV